MMNLTIEEMKVVRGALNKAPLSRGVIDMIERMDAELKAAGWKYEHRALPKVKYQRNQRHEYVWVEINNQ